MFIELTRPVDCLRLRGAAGLLAAVMDDLGGRLVASGDAVELTVAEFDRRLCEGHDGGSDRFELANDPPAPAQRDVDLDVGRFAQRPLFAGLDCLPGQLDLFCTDGRTEDFTIP